MKDVKNKPSKTFSLSVETVNKCKVSKPAKKQIDFTKRIKAIEKQLKALFVGASGLVTNRQALTFASMWLKVHTDSTNNPPVYDDATAGLAILAANVLHEDRTFLAPDKDFENLFCNVYLATRLLNISVAHAQVRTGRSKNKTKGI